jgi:uncharacterized protein (TIGR02001 family)
MKKFLKLAGVAAVASTALIGAAQAEDREFSWSMTVGATSDYVFRGMSNTDRDPAIQGSLDIAYGIFYAGVWASNTDYPNFGGPCVDNGTPCNNIGEIGSGEVDYYFGVKPVWGGITFDFAFLYYTFPGQQGEANDGDYLELKAGASVTPVENLSLTVLNFYSPNAQWKSGETYTLEGAAAYTLPQIGMFTPTVSATLGSQWGFDDDYVAYGMAWGEDQYLYWNAGVALAVEKLTLDFRYWDTDLGGADNANCDTGRSNGASFQCGPTFVVSAKVTLP